MLFEPSAHESLTQTPWDEQRARAAIDSIAADAESAFDPDTLWPAHPLDLEGGPLSAVASLYLGASGVIWALHELDRLGAAEPLRDWTAVAAGLVARYRAHPDLQDIVDGPVPSFWVGESGILLVAHALAPAAWHEERLLEVVRANAANPSWELMWGSPGTMIAARIMDERTGAPQWREAWGQSADLLWAEWRDELWLQDLYGSRVHILSSPAPGGRRRSGRSGVTVRRGSSPPLQGSHDTMTNCRSF